MIGIITLTLSPSVAFLVLGTSIGLSVGFMMCAILSHMRVSFLWEDPSKANGRRTGLQG
jgi:hypothetical protein